MFILCINCLKQILSQPQINNDIYNLIHHINKNVNNYITVDTLFNFFKSTLKRMNQKH